MSHFNIDPKPENYVHKNGIKGIAKVVYRTGNVQTWLQVLKKRSFLALIWGVGAAIVAGIIVLIFGLTGEIV